MDSDWDCPHASDDIDIFKIIELSEHNARLHSQAWLWERKEDRIASKYSVSPSLFPTLCNRTTEYECILVSVYDPLNFTVNRPCINLTQIGDGVIDCYGGLDEQNILSCGNITSQQRGFDFHCSDQECIPYHRQCK
jgi:hypothetical protein